MIKKRVFWLVWSPTGSTPPKVLHYSQEEAEFAAEEMAINNEGKTFFVVQAVGYAEMPNRRRFFVPFNG